MSARDDIVRAFEQNDHAAIKAAGWWDTWDALHRGWAPRQTATANDMVAFVKLLGNEDPADVLDAIEACAGEWRPLPGELKGYLNRKRGAGDGARVDVGRGKAVCSRSEALDAVTAAVTAGAAVCSCGRPPTTWPRGSADSTGVLHCPDCRGLEQGQVWAAEDRDGTAGATVALPGSVVKLKRIGGV